MKTFAWWMAGEYYETVIYIMTSLHGIPFGSCFPIISGNILKIKKIDVRLNLAKPF